MGRNKVSSAEKKRKGNPGKRDIPDEIGVDSPPLRCPSGLSKAEKKYWRIWSASLTEVGKLTILSLPSFLDLIKMKARLDQINDLIKGSDEKCETCGKQNNRSLLQESKFVDSSGQEHSTFKESAYSKLSRDLIVAVHRLEKAWGLTADSMAGLFKKKPKKSEEEKFLG
jgi:hypothetical protein